MHSDTEIFKFQTIDLRIVLTSTLRILVKKSIDG